MSSNENHEQIEYWNAQAGHKWVTMQERLDAQLDPLGRLVMDRLAVQAGERVIDVGCGCGATTAELATRVGAQGQVLGLDISEPMLARARERTAAAPQATFARNDAQTHTLDPAAADVVFSRFGVMFFADPAAAFANLRRGLRPGGRLGFICWQVPTANEWVLVPMRAILVHVPPPPIPGPRTPGPFAFAEADYVREILGRAGFTDVTVDPDERRMEIAGGADLDEVVDFLLQIGPAARALQEAKDPDARPRVAESLRATLRPHLGAGGVGLGSATWIVLAKAPVT
jgi:ubiquinone/menaquinone biosynthesis C-methylase UbiE